MSDEFWLSRIQADIARLQQVVDQQATELAELQARDREQAMTITALLEILADAGQLDRSELQARIRAAAIDANHTARVGSEASQDIWDSAKGKP